MLYSRLFGKTNKTFPADADSVNARLLVQAGFIDQLMAGVYSYLPLGLRVLSKIEKIIREEMNALGAQELLMPALHPKENWEKTGRWTDPGKEVMFQLKGRGDKDFGLGWTHEEIVTPLAKKFIHSYRDLPFAVYQIQDKFRNEPRAKSGLLRGREFWMKDMYSFHADEKDLEDFYQQSITAYENIFTRCGLTAVLTEASGGSFSKYSHEFQVLTGHGEDIIFMCDNCSYAQNKEIATFKDGATCLKCGKGMMHEKKAIEAGNIFQLKAKYSDAFDLTFTDEKGVRQKVLMGCYGLGPSRVMGAIAEVLSDKNGLCWPASVAPFGVHIVPLNAKTPSEQKAIDTETAKVLSILEKAGVEALVDDRDIRPGEKFADADLIGCPIRVVISEKTLAKKSVEWKERCASEEVLVKISELGKKLNLL